MAKGLTSGGGMSISKGVSASYSVVCGEGEGVSSECAINSKWGDFKERSGESAHLWEEPL